MSARSASMLATLSPSLIAKGCTISRPPNAVRVTITALAIRESPAFRIVRFASRKLVADIASNSFTLRASSAYVVFTNSGYSSSTAKHKSIVLNACNHITRVYCSNPDANAYTNKNAALRQVENALIASEKKGIRQTTIDKCKALALHNAEQFNTYLAALPKAERTEKPINTAKLDQFRAAMIRQQKREAKAREKAQIEQAKKQAEYLADWRNDPTMRTIGMHGLPVALRLSGDIVQTSHGAEIPVSDALRLWPVIQRVKGGEKDYTPGMPIGNYRLTQIKTTGDIVVGCHNIPFSEIEAVSKLLGL